MLRGSAFGAVGRYSPRPYPPVLARGGRRFWPTASSWHSTDFGQGVSLGEPNVAGQTDKSTRSCLNTGHLAPQPLPGTGFAEFLPFWQWASDGDLMMGRVGVAGWDGEKVNWGLFIGEKPPEQEERTTWDRLSSWEWWRTALWGLAKRVVVTVAVVGGLALISLIPVVGVPLAIGIGVGLLAYGVGSAIHNRLTAGQSWGQAIGGGLLDLVGVSGIYTGLTGYDLVTGQDLGLALEEEGEAFGSGVGMLASLAIGPKVFKGVRNFVRGRAEARFVREVAFRANRRVEAQLANPASPRYAKVQGNPGVAKHLWAQRLVEHYQKMYKPVGRGLTVEQVYLKGIAQEGRSLPPKAIKLDVVAGRVERPVHVYDYKFTSDPANAILRPGRIAEIQTKAPIGRGVRLEAVHWSQRGGTWWARWLW